MWWLSARKARRDGVRSVLLVPAVGALLAGLEGRVIFRAFGQYLRLSPPWSYLAITVALYGTALLVVLHVAGAQPPVWRESVQGIKRRCNALSASLQCVQRRPCTALPVADFR